MPVSWEKRVSLFCAYLIDSHKTQSSTIRSYISAIKNTLRNDGYKWVDDRVYLDLLIKLCKITNDTLMARLPIQFKLFELILFELGRVMINQPYLEILYRAIFCLSYYGLMRVGEVSQSLHNVKALDVHIAENKDKIMIILYSSKTQNKVNRPQEIKISRSEHTGRNHKFFCPFKALRAYIMMRSSVSVPDEPFFIYSDKRAMPTLQLRTVLRQILTNLNINPMLYNFQSFHIGWATDMMKFGFCVD